jgi:hypothetical protein
MTNHPNRNRRIWHDGSRVCLRDVDDMGEQIIRQFWVPPSGGYVREVDADHPGTLGQQVTAQLGTRGYTLTSDPDRLLDLIRREYRARCAAERRENERWNGFYPTRKE